MKPTSRLFSNVDDRDYERAFEMVQQMRQQFPSYRDDELLMFLLTKELNSRKAVRA